jgi:DNA adenine methylase
MNEVKRPILRYHGGKWMLAPWIIEHMPAHRVYTESFVGAAVRAQADVYADQTTPLVAPITDLHEVHEILAQSRKDELAALGQVIEQQRAELQKAAA